MATTKSTSAGISQRTQTYAAVQMLGHAQPVIVLDKFGKVKPMPKNKGVNIKFRRPISLAPATTPLVEGVTPNSTQFKYEDVSCSLQQYGNLIEITDVIQDTHEDPVLQDATMISGENMGETKEALTYGVLKAGTSVFYSNGSARNAVNSKLNIGKLRAVNRFLKAQKAKRYTKVLDGSVKIGTKPVEASYICVAHTDCESDIRDLPGFVPVAEYGTKKTVHEAEIGTVESFRFVLSPDLAPFEDAGGAAGAMKSTGGANADVYPMLFFGKEAYGVVPLKGKEAVEPTVIPPDTKDKSDPLGQRGYVGWKTYHAAVILNDAWMCRLEVGVSDL